MELKIYWTDFSKQELKEIYNYYKEKASITLAKSMAIGIAKEVDKLKSQPKIGQEEVLLENDLRDFRYLLYNDHYKIIYWVNLEKNRIEIFDVFDTRQNPIKIKRNK
jgi:plasmid stabilization system protein ParE